ncbi:dihydrofolate reductase family protein [Actinophytocola oryzae]|nr:dihydrofolate reductase family protein [Actinophytocola oryzae]
MRKLVYLVASTIDGHIAAPGGGDPTGIWPMPPEYISYLVEEFPETLPGPAREAMGITAEGTHFDTVVEGRGSFEVGLAAGLQDAYPHLRHLVFSRTLTSEHVEVVSTDPGARVRELKQERGKDIWLVGGATLAGALYDEIDRLVVKLGPLTIGTGMPFLRHGFAQVDWRLTAYDRAGDALVITYDR